MVMGCYGPPVRVLLTMAVLASSIACAPVIDDAILVLAASSMTEPLERIGERFEDERGVGVTFSFGASSDLARQISEGAIADVFISADERQVERLGPRLEAPVVIARNRLAIAVPAGDPERIAGLHDLSRDGLIVALCAVDVPCGRYAARALDGAGVTVAEASREQHVRAVLTKVRLGEADAGIVYRTDAASGVELIDVADEVIATYPAAVVTSSEDRDAARGFVAFLRSDAAVRILVGHGFDA